MSEVYCAHTFLQEDTSNLYVINRAAQMGAVMCIEQQICIHRSAYNVIHIYNVGAQYAFDIQARSTRRMASY
jgi:hypothetical protein